MELQAALLTGTTMVLPCVSVVFMMNKAYHNLEIKLDALKSAFERSNLKLLQIYICSL
jgi:hypothetical protein